VIDAVTVGLSVAWLVCGFCYLVVSFAVEDCRWTAPFGPKFEAFYAVQTWALRLFQAITGCLFVLWLLAS
jgi:hypothetical protein